MEQGCLCYFNDSLFGQVSRAVRELRGLDDRFLVERRVFLLAFGVWKRCDGRFIR